ncbi:MAG: hypothetical protein RRY95_02315 [Oscillospiraceae bacterium]
MLHLDAFGVALKLMGQGLVGIFAVILLLWLFIALLRRFCP